LSREVRSAKDAQTDYHRPRANASKSGKGGSKNSAFLRILSDSE